MNSIPVNSYGIASVVIKCNEKESKILLLNRNERPNNIWCYVSGKIESGEKAWEAALREIKEETDLEPNKLYSADIYEQFYEVHKDSIWISPVFVAYVSENDRVKINHEHSEFKWFSINDAIETLVFPGQRKILEHIKNEFIERKPSDWLLIK